MATPIPEWFKQQEEQKTQASLVPAELQKRWMAYSSQSSPSRTLSFTPPASPSPALPSSSSQGTTPIPFLPSSGNSTAQSTDESDPLTKFNTMVLNLLQNAQKGQLEQKSTLENAQNANAMAPASSLGINNLTPGDALAARGRLATQYNPAISNINDRVQLFSQTLQYAKDLGETYFKNIQPSKETIEAVKNQLRAGFVPSAEILEKVGKYLTEDDWAQAATANNKNGAEVNISPGTNEFKIAQDLAYGNLTFAQFKGLYSYSRNVNAKLAIYNKASELNPNFNPANFELGYKIASNAKIRQQVASQDNALARIDDMAAVSNAAARSGIPLLNKIILPAGFNLGGKAYSDFRTAQLAMADEISGALGFGSATDMTRQLGIEMTNPNMSPEQFNSALDQVRNFLISKRQSLVNQMGIYGASVNDFSGGSSNFTGSPEDGERGLFEGHNYTFSASTNTWNP